MSKTKMMALEPAAEAAPKSKNFEKYKKFYDAGLWTKKMVYNVVTKGALTAEEYEEIIGEAFPEE